MKSFVLVTGGCGYIGSHICVELLQQGENVLIFDNLSNSKASVVKKIRKISQKSGELHFFKGDVRDIESLHSVFQTYSIKSVIHLAGVKSVSESLAKPVEYYDINVGGTLNLMNVMKSHEVRNLIFSSSATVYGDSPVPFNGLKEEDVKAESVPQNPYGRSKKMAETILKDSVGFKIAILRYFNPLGAHSSGLIGDKSKDNLMPRLLFATKYSGVFHVYGDTYPTRDGTPIRDYIHVVDLARGHLKILDSLENDYWTGSQVFNLGTGKGYTVLEVLVAFQNATGQKLKYDIDEPRKGDVAISFANCDKAIKKGFEATHTLDEMCRDHFNFCNTIKKRKRVVRKRCQKKRTPLASSQQN